MAFPRRRLRCDRVLLFAAGLVLVLVYAWSLVPRDPVQLEVRDVKEGLRQAQERDQGRDQERDQDMDQSKDQKRDQDMDQSKDQKRDQDMDQSKDQKRDQDVDQSKDQKRDQDVDQGKDQKRDQDVDQGKDQKRDQDVDQSKDQKRDQDVDQGKDQGKARPPVVLTVNRTDIETCIYVDKPEPVPTEPPTSDSPNKSKKQYPVDQFSLEQRRRGWVLLHVFGMVYMFVALAIVCDEFFVPALEVITVKLQISDDVAGATFMAAGGSAPELFTSLIGVFIARSNVGIGTIVGSAVFNILFVIGMCAIFSREMLHLTWWPLFRDVTFYILDLMMLIVFFLDNAIRWWESALLVSSYICYVTFMKFNAQIEALVKRGCGKHKGTVQVWSGQQPDKVTEATPALPAPAPKPKSRPAPEPRPAARPAARPGPKPELKLEVKVEVKTGVKPVRPDLQFEVKPRAEPESQKPELRRTSDPQDQRRPKTRPVLQRGGSAASLHNASMRNTIFQLMIHTLDPLTEDLSLNGDLRAAQRRAKGKVKPLTEGLAAAEENNVLQDGEQKPECEPSGAEPSTSHKPDDKLPEKTAESLYETQIPEESERSSGSSSSSSSEDEEGDEEAEEEEEEESAPLSLDWPQTCPKRASYLLLLPIVFPLWVTLPDVRNADSRRFFAMTFMGSILWIGIFSYLMVWWAHQVGETVGISEEIMGLTILAAGTSIPDLITSVIVARKGLGDMAVSSSVGSNIFDITVGLPVPWLLFSLSHGGQAVRVSSNGLFCAIVLLFLMLLFVIISIAVCRWKMSRTLGLTMFLLYFLFLLLSVLLEDRILTCPVSV